MSLEVRLHDGTIADGVLLFTRTPGPEGQERFWVSLSDWVFLAYCRHKP